MAIVEESRFELLKEQIKIDTDYLIKMRFAFFPSASHLDAIIYIKSSG
jgi:hypothetical protein